MKSEIITDKGIPKLFVDGKPICEAAYITYYTYNNRYSDFAEMGYRLYSVPVFFGTQTINEMSRIPPLGTGIFDDDIPDFSEADRNIEMILSACPDALIFPRVNTSLPSEWERNNPDELCDFGYSEPHRPCFSSDKWAEEVKRLLRLYIAHISASPYREHIIGYQIAGGNTEEWFSFDFKGSIGKRSREKYTDYLKDNSLPDTEANLYRFLSHITASRICEFAHTVKEETQGELVVGSFYGYTLECVSRESCHHALGELLRCDDIDFICSPVSYINTRSYGQDSANMLPLDSLKLHGKLYFSENDTRTHLSKAPNQLPAYQNPIWFGPNREKSVGMIKEHFSRALTHGHAMWWFDMWGGWYDDDEYRRTLTVCHEIAESAAAKNIVSKAEAAVYIDERAYDAISGGEGGFCYSIRHTLGLTSVPYDIYLADDFALTAEKYKAAILLEPSPTPLSEEIKNGAKIPLLVITQNNSSITTDEIRTFFSSSGVHMYSARDTVVYAGGDYVFMHTHSSGVQKLFLPQGITSVRECFTGTCCTSAQLAQGIECDIGESLLWEIV